MSDMSNCKNCGHPEVAHSKGELKCWIGHHCSCAGFEAGYADTKQAPLTTETPASTTLEAEKFVGGEDVGQAIRDWTYRDDWSSLADLFASFADKIAAEKVQAEREKWQRELIESLDSFIEKLRGTK